MRRFVGIAALCFAVGCGDSTSPGPGGQFQLSATQAATLEAQLGLLVDGDPEVGWLADSAKMVLREGAFVDTVSITTSLGSGPYYGVGLQRAISSATNKFSTFDAILFNDLSNPTRFIVVSGFAKSETSAPVAMSGPIGSSPTQSLNAHFYSIDDGAITHWRATSGSGAFASGEANGFCPSLITKEPLTCSSASLMLTVQVNATVKESGGAPGSPTLVSDNRALPGIRLNFTYF